MTNWKRVGRNQSLHNWVYNLAGLSKAIKNLSHDSSTQATFETGISWMPPTMLQLHQLAGWFEIYQGITCLATWRLQRVMFLCRCNIKFIYDVQLLSWATQCHMQEDHNLKADFTLLFNFICFRSKYFLSTSVSNTLIYILFQSEKTKCYNCVNQMANVPVCVCHSWHSNLL
jgi:hypothetical protein